MLLKEKLLIQGDIVNGRPSSVLSNFSAENLRLGGKRIFASSALCEKASTRYASYELEMLLDVFEGD